MCCKSKNEIIDFSRKYKKKYNYKCVGFLHLKKMFSNTKIK